VAVADLPVGSGTPVEGSVVLAVAAAVRRLPWEPSCLSQAATVQFLLRRRGESGVVVIGLRRADPDGPWESHAWLLGRSGALTGGPAATGFTPVTVFGDPGRPISSGIEFGPPGGGLGAARAEQ
jgi:hypothetical protein